MYLKGHLAVLMIGFYMSGCDRESVGKELALLCDPASEEQVSGVLIPTVLEIASADHYDSFLANYAREAPVVSSATPDFSFYCESPAQILSNAYLDYLNEDLSDPASLELTNMTVWIGDNDTEAFIGSYQSLAKHCTDPEQPAGNVLDDHTVSPTGISNNRLVIATSRSVLYRMACDPRVYLIDYALNDIQHAPE